MSEALERSQPTPKCGHHPERDADGGTCQRCGTFVCDECWVIGSEPALCTACLAHLSGGPNIRHVRVAAVLMIVQAVLLGLLGSYYVVFGGFLLDAVSGEPAATDSTALMLPEFVSAGLSLIGLTQILIAGLGGFAGWRLFRFQSRVLGIAAAVIGLLSLLGCYCFPSAMLLGPYALWVLTRDDVIARFRFRLPAKLAGTRDEPVPPAT